MPLPPVGGSRISDRHRYRKPEITDPEFAKQLWQETDRLIAQVEKASAKRRVVEKKKNPEAQQEEKEAKERAEKRRAKLAEAEAREALLNRLIKEEDEKRMRSMDLPPAVFAPVTPQKMAPAPTSDTPARNTRSKSRAAQTPVPETRPVEEVGSDKTTTRRRTKKA